LAVDPIDQQVTTIGTSSCIPHDVASDAEQPKAILRRLGQFGDPSPGHQVDIRYHVIDFGLVRHERPCGVGIDAAEGRLVEGPEPGYRIVTGLIAQVRPINPVPPTDCPHTIPCPLGGQDLQEEESSLPADELG